MTLLNRIAMMCTIVIRDVVGVLIFDIMALLVRGAVTFDCNDSAMENEKKKLKNVPLYAPKTKILCI